jgi:hypothetical protein
LATQIWAPDCTGRDQHFEHSHLLAERESGGALLDAVPRHLQCRGTRIATGAIADAAILSLAFIHPDREGQIRSGDAPDEHGRSLAWIVKAATRSPPEPHCDIRK